MQKQYCDTVTITFNRNGNIREEQIKLIEVEKEITQVGLGILLEDHYEIDIKRNVKINVGDIGGPSAGLMFSLEIYNQTVNGDFTKGYNISGTGTIDMDGNVGQVGGIQEKITAVEKAGMDIFFCPVDLVIGDTNEYEVKAKAKKEAYKVMVIPVKNLQEAIDYLEKLPPKKENG